MRTVVVRRCPSKGVSSSYTEVQCDTVRPNLDGTDSDGQLNRPQWIIPLNQDVCHMQAITDSDVTEYHMYWNQNPLKGDVNFALMNQVSVFGFNKRIFALPDGQVLTRSIKNTVSFEL